MFDDVCRLIETMLMMVVMSGVLDVGGTEGEDEILDIGAGAKILRESPQAISLTTDSVLHF